MLDHVSLGVTDLERADGFMMQFCPGHHKLSARSQHADRFEHADQLVLHCITVVKDGTCGSSLASNQISRARLA